MNRRHVNAAITAGLALTMTVGSVPSQAFAEMIQGDTTQVVAEQSDATGATAASADTGRQPRKIRRSTRSPRLRT